MRNIVSNVCLFDGFENNPQWISRSGALLNEPKCTAVPIPFFRRLLKLDGLPESAKIFICGIGYYELYLNGSKVGDHVLDPVVTQYSQRSRYLVYDVTKQLISGENVIGVILANGWYTAEYPRLCFKLQIDGKMFLRSDGLWKVTSGPILSAGLFTGEIYDARKELTGWLCHDYDDSDWENCEVVAPPGGHIEEQTMPACKVIKTLHPVKSWTLPDGKIVYDMGQNFAGWVRVNVKGKCGSEITLQHAEKLNKNNDVIMSTKNKGFQTDHYILKGSSTEKWEPRFTYHGFRYVKIDISPSIEIVDIKGIVVSSSFEEVGAFSCSDDSLNQLQKCFQWSYISNFVGIPTDCPHREKAGWTADAHLVTESGLFNYDASEAYRQWLDNFTDVQRPNGQLPGIIPTSRDGFIWECGPAWDSALFLIPWYIYLYTGNDISIKSNYDAMKKYIDYCSLRAEDNIVSFGLSDWCHPRQPNKHPWKQPVNSSFMTPLALIATAYYYTDCKLLAKFSQIADKPNDTKKYSTLAERIKKSFNKRFYKGRGIYANGCQTAQACPLYHNLVDETEIPLVAATLAEEIEHHDYKVDFGIHGSKYVLRALADNGYVNVGYKMLTQPNYPGWVNWLNTGHTTLSELWDGSESQNHPSFGDFSGWMFKYLAGICPDHENPGFKHFVIKPLPVEGLNWVKAQHLSPYGAIVVRWEKKKDKFITDIEIPKNTTATLELPDATTYTKQSGKYHIEVNLL